jgi:hypothetical protein
MVQRLHQILLSAAHLQRERALAASGNSSSERSACRSRAEPEPVEAARRKHDRVEPALAALAQRVSMLPRSGSIDSSARARAVARAGAPTPCRRACPAAAHGAAERVTRDPRARVGADDEAFRVGRRHVLGRVHCDVDPPVEQRLLELP